MINLTNCNGTKQESKCLLIFILTRRFSHQTERKEFPGPNQSATQNPTDLRYIVQSSLNNTCISKSETMFILTQNSKKSQQQLLVFDWHCRILILTCTVDVGNNGLNCTVSLLIQGFTNSLLLVAYFFSPCKITFIYIFY